MKNKHIWTYFVYNYIRLYVFIYIYIYSYMKNFFRANSFVSYKNASNEPNLIKTGSEVATLFNINLINLLLWLGDINNLI